MTAIDRFAHALFDALISGIRESPDGTLRKAHGQVVALRLADVEQLADDIERVLVHEIETAESLTSESIDTLHELVEGMSGVVNTYVLYLADRIDTIRDDSVGKASVDLYVAAAQGLASDARAKGDAIFGAMISAIHNGITVLAANEAGVHEFRYSGPNDKVTRDWCQQFVGKVVTLDELRDARGEFGRVETLPIIMLGGFNCRHTLVPHTQGE